MSQHKTVSKIQLENLITVMCEIKYDPKPLNSSVFYKLEIFVWCIAKIFSMLLFYLYITKVNSGI